MARALRVVILWIGLAVVPVASAAFNNNFPGVSLTISNLVDNQVIQYELPPVREGLNDAGQPVWVFEPYQLETPEFRVNIQATLDPDPSIAYGLSVIDFGAPTSFIFGFFTPIVPTGSPNDVSATVIGELLDARGDGVTLTPVFSSLQIGELGSPDTNMGVDLGSGDSHGPGTPDTSYPYGPYAVGPLPGPGPGPWTFLQTTVAFGLGGDNDQASFDGVVSIVESSGVVPEPGTVLGGGALCAGIAFGMIRRRRARS